MIWHCNRRVLKMLIDNLHISTDTIQASKSSYQKILAPNHFIQNVECN